MIELANIAACFIVFALYELYLRDYLAGANEVGTQCPCRYPKQLGKSGDAPAWDRNSCYLNPANFSDGGKFHGNDRHSCFDRHLDA